MCGSAASSPIVSRCSTCCGRNHCARTLLRRSCGEVTTSGRCALKSPVGSCRPQTGCAHGVRFVLRASPDGDDVPREHAFGPAVELAEGDVVARHEAAERGEERSRKRLVVGLDLGRLDDEPADAPLIARVESVHRS